MSDKPTCIVRDYSDDLCPAIEGKGFEPVTTKTLMVGIGREHKWNILVWDNWSPDRASYVLPWEFME